jgi:hypothetical protein
MNYRSRPGLKHVTSEMPNWRDEDVEGAAGRSRRWWAVCLSDGQWKTADANAIRQCGCGQARHWTQSPEKARLPGCQGVEGGDVTMLAWRRQPADSRRLADAPKS